jgi:GntR family transcriptional regulator, transcriptional repressor for pyruvate dehydrogenase complex
MTTGLLDNSFKIVGIKRRRLHEPVADQIRQAIFGGLIVPGHKLPPERELAEHFQTSRVALREALRALEKEGLITIKRGAGGGAFVAEADNALNALSESLNTVVKLGSAKSANLTEMRSILEPEVSRLATLRATPEDVSAIEAVVIAQEKELEEGEISRKLDMEFHRCVAAAAHNNVLSIVVNAVNQSIRDSILRSKRTKEMRKRVVKYHRDILEALRGGNAELAKRIMGSHVVDVQCHIETSDNE